MKKIMIIVGIVIIYFFMYFLHVNFFDWFTIAGIKPNLFVLLVLFIGLYTGEKCGAISGFIIGLYTDFLFSNKIGGSAILLLIVGFAGGYLDKKFSKDEGKMTIIVMGIIATSFYEVMFYIYNMIVLSVEFNIGSFLYILSIELLYNVLLIIILYPIINRLGCYAENIFKNKDISPRYF